ncbi:hypothetical protein SAMN02745244_00055 [Tessaracoccus bendigoensis DSM 12906]|uniref:Uncharacterized protein n=1 Tax=Tessaracoccus bendigoensis DSM 12906 TaxID=1123357 RepID=A0A1M6A1T4_9ACTN|nr:hypothetical protein [Tessaracoccus bendigoensis]SHI30395.1 hypothetical protein SAMN02745244_00055 [Tessaracoccus bendigoensis DSM 12906]
MTHQGLAAKAVGAVMAAALIGGCTAAPTNSPTPTGPSQSSSPSPTVTPTLSPEDQKLEDAKTRVVLLWQTLDGLLVDSSKSINELDTLASGEALSSLQVMLTTVRERGQVQVGATRIPSQSAVAKDDGWVVTSCVDRSDAILTDKAGQPVTPAPQPRLSHESTVQLVGANLQITKDEVLGSC